MIYHNFCLARAQKRPPRARAHAPIRLKISVETYFFMPVTFGFLQHGQIQPPSIVFVELKLSGLFSLRTDVRTYVRTPQYSTHSNSVQLSLFGVGQLPITVVAWPVEKSSHYSMWALTYIFFVHRTFLYFPRTFLYLYVGLSYQDC